MDHPLPAPSRSGSPALWISERWVLPFAVGGVVLGLAILALLALGLGGWSHDAETTQRLYRSISSSMAAVE